MGEKTSRQNSPIVSVNSVENVINGDGLWIHKSINPIQTSMPQTIASSTSTSIPADSIPQEPANATGLLLPHGAHVETPLLPPRTTANGSQEKLRKREDSVKPISEATAFI